MKDTKSPNWKIITIMIVSSFLIALFVYTGLNKLLDLDNFRFQLGRSPYMVHWVNFIAIPVPVIELLIAFGLIFTRTRLLALFASFGLMALFTGYVWIMLTYSPYLPCSCGGIIQKLTWKQHLTFNGWTTFFAAGAAYLQYTLRHPSLNRQPKDQQKTSFAK